MRRPFIQNGRTAVAVGLVLFAVAAFVLYDAYDRRGRRAPWPLSAVMPF